MLNKVTRMSNSDNKTLKINNPVEGCVFYHPRDFITQLETGFFYNLSSLPINYIESNRRRTDCSME